MYTGYILCVKNSWFVGLLFIIIYFFYVHFNNINKFKSIDDYIKIFLNWK